MNRVDPTRSMKEVMWITFSKGIYFLVFSLIICNLFLLERPTPRQILFSVFFTSFYGIFSYYG